MTTKTSTNQNKLLDNDELEEEFLKCNLEDLPLPIKKLEDFEFEINEVMKSGCNRQIAEYSLLEYESDLLPQPKDEHEKSKDSIKKTLSELKNEYKKSKKSIKENMPNILYYINTAKYEKDEKSTYEEEADEIFEENIKEIEGNENYKIEDTDAIKEFIMSDFKSRVEALESKDKEIFVKSRKNYRDKRDAIIEAALRLVKKIVNDEKEYKKFEEGYKKLQEDNNKNN